MADMYEQTLTIVNELGLHARAATKFVQLAAKYSTCEVSLVKDGHEVNGKSIMGVLMLVASKGSTVTVRARGKDAEAAVSALCQLIKERFGEAR